MKRALFALLVWGLLACGGTASVTELNVRVTGLPQFVCPSSTPRPTHTALPTHTQAPTATPALLSTPWVYLTSTPACNFLATPSARYACIPNACLFTLYPHCGVYFIRPTQIPLPAGHWVGGGVGYSATATPRPTFTPYPTQTPYPTPTPYVLSENYPMGADVYVGNTGSLQLRFQISNPRTLTLNSTQQVVLFEVTVENVGTVPYQALPGAQVFVSHLLQGTTPQAGLWFASQEATHLAHFTLDSRALDIVTLTAGQTLTLTLTALTPLGHVHKIAWILDPYSGGAGQGQVGGNTALWVNQPDPHHCVGNVGDSFIPPTPLHTAPTATASVTPYLRPYSGYSP